MGRVVVADNHIYGTPFIALALYQVYTHSRKGDTMFGDLFGVFGLAGKGDRPTTVHCCVYQVYCVYCTLAPTSWFLICTALCASTITTAVTTLRAVAGGFVVHRVQDLPNAAGEGGSNDRVRSGGFSATTEAQNDFLSDTAVTESVAALGKPCCAVK